MPKEFSNNPESEAVVNDGGKKVKRVALVDLGGAVEEEARDAADVAMSKSTDRLKGPRLFKGEGRTSKEQLAGFGNVLKRIWKHNLLEAYYRNKEVNKARKKILDSDNLYASADAEGAISDEHAKEAIVGRFVSEYGDEMIHTEAGETRKKLGDAGRESHYKNQIKDLIVRFSTTNMTVEGLRMERDTILDEMAQGDDALITKGNMFAENLIKVAQEIKEQVDSAVDHQQRLQALDFELEVVVGEAKAGVRTEANFDRVDRLVDKMKRNKVGQFVSETSLATAVALSYSVGAAASKRLASSKLFAWGTLGASAVFGAGLAAARERHKITEERRQHGRDMAKGKSFDAEKSPRRVEMEKFRIQTVDINQICDNLEDSRKRVNGLDRNGLMVAVAELADLEARVSLSDQQHIDLLSYSDFHKVDAERLRADGLRVQMKRELRAKLAQVDPTENFDNVLRQMTDIQTQRLIHGAGGAEGIEAKDRAFQKMRRSRSAKAAAVGLATGLVVGGAFQELRAALSDRVEGLADGLRGGKQPIVEGKHIFTPLETIRRWFAGELKSSSAEGNFHDVTLFSGQTVKLPEGVEFVSQGDQTYNLVRDGDVVASGLVFGGRGDLDPASIARLQAEGVQFNTVHEQITNVVNRETSITPGQYAQLHAKDMMGVHRHNWYQNDNPKPDLNELKQWWGGKFNVGVDKSGNYVFDIKRMIPKGSFFTDNHGARHEINPMAGGVVEKLKLLVSVSRDTQNQAFEFSVDAAGNAIIPKDSEAGQHLFTLDSKGHAKFLGKFAEIAEVIKQRQDGSEDVNIVSTVVGPGLPNVTEVIPIPIPQDVAVTQFILPSDYQMEPPWVIPIRDRKGLESAKGREQHPYGAYEVRGRAEFYRQRGSPRLRENSDARLDFQEEADWYLHREQEQNGSYYKDLLKTLEQEGMRKPMDERCRLAACVPVYDLGEGKVVGHALEQYYKQIENGSVRPEEFELVLFLNHPKDKRLAMKMESGAKERVKRGAPEAYDTEEVIKQFCAAHPEMRVRVMKKEFTERPKWGWIIKYAYDAAMIRSLARRKGKGKDILVATNDIDVRDMSDTYVHDIITTMDTKDAEVKDESGKPFDGLVGRIDHSNETYRQWPNFFVATRFDQFLDAQSRYGYSGDAAPEVSAGGYTYGLTERGGAKGSDQRKREKHVITQGRNTVLKGSAYCAVGGANVGTDAGADTELGHMVRFGRKGFAENASLGAHTPFAYQNSIWLETDPRRELGMYKKGEPVASAWKEWDQMNVYGKTYHEQIRGDAETLNAGRLESEFAETMKKWGVSADSRMVERAMHWLGFVGEDYKIVGGKIKINSLDHLKGAMDKWVPYRQRKETAKQKSAGSK